jgi:endogenous inhibitor of DNA gyrase (YacG/DUF329 family)
MKEVKPRLPGAIGAEILPLRAPRPCPVCERESTRAAYPFCSKHCADVDLHRWLSGGYAIAQVEQDDGGNSDGEP